MELLIYGAPPSRDTDGHRGESGGLDLDSDAIEAIWWLRGTEVETHLLLPDPPRGQDAASRISFYWSRGDKLTVLRLTHLIKTDTSLCTRYEKPPSVGERGGIAR